MELKKYFEPNGEQIIDRRAPKNCTNFRAPRSRPEKLEPKLIPKSTPFLIPTTFFGCNGSAIVGNEKEILQESRRGYNHLNDEELDKETNQLATFGMGVSEMGRAGIEPATHGFSVRCSTD